MAAETEPIGAMTRCAACGHTQPAGSPVLRADPDHRPFDLVICTRCGMVQQYPRYTDQQFRALYGGDYYVFEEDETRRWGRAVQQYVVHLLLWEDKRCKRLLDVGCALGHLAALAERRGWRVTGLDLSAEAISRAATRFGLDFRAGTLEQFRETLPPFDVILLGDVIEHVPRPAAFMQAVRQILAPGGITCLDTPNWGGRWRRISGRHWLGLNRYHINLFQSQSLARLLTDNGFVDVRTASYTHYRYQLLTDRPEIRFFLQKLPEWLAWRVNRFLARRSGFGPWSGLRASPPDSLDAADDFVNRLTPLRSTIDTGRLTSDNLIATARRE